MNYRYEPSYDDDQVYQEQLRDLEYERWLDENYQTRDWEDMYVKEWCEYESNF